MVTVYLAQGAIKRRVLVVCDVSPSPDFQTTRWSIVRAAGGSDSAAAREALAVLCETYWYPLYAFVRRSGRSKEDAEDLTQSFFARLLDKRDIRGADPGRGKFRNYLLGALRHFLANEQQRARAAKRGGGRAPFSIDFPEADRRYNLVADDRSSPDRLFEHEWAVALLARAMAGLRAEYGARGKQETFDRLRPALLGDTDAGARARLAAAAGMQVGAFNTALHRLRKRFQQRLRDEVAHTVKHPGEIDQELRFLRSALEG